MKVSIASFLTHRRRDIMQRNKIYSSKSFWKYRKLAKAITLDPPKHVDWKDIVRNKIMPCLTNPISGVTGTPEEKKAFFEFVKEGRFPCLAKRVRKTGPFQLLHKFDVDVKLVKGKKQLSLWVHGGVTSMRIPASYSKDDELEPGMYVVVCHYLEGKTMYRFREKEIMTQSFKETWDGELTEENVWKAYTNLSALLHNITQPNYFCNHVRIGDESGTIDDPKYVHVCSHRPWTCQHKQCIWHNHAK